DEFQRPLRHPDGPAQMRQQRVEQPGVLGRELVARAPHQTRGDQLPSVPAEAGRLYMNEALRMVNLVEEVAAVVEVVVDDLLARDRLQERQPWHGREERIRLCETVVREEP